MVDLFSETTDLLLLLLLSNIKNVAPVSRVISVPQGMLGCTCQPLEAQVVIISGGDVHPSFIEGSPGAPQTLRGSCNSPHQGLISHEH